MSVIEAEIRNLIQSILKTNCYCTKEDMLSKVKNLEQLLNKMNHHISEMSEKILVLEQRMNDLSGKQQVRKGSFFNRF